MVQVLLFQNKFLLDFCYFYLPHITTILFSFTYLYILWAFQVKSDNSEYITTWIHYWFIKKKSKQFSKQSRHHLYPSYTPWKSWKEPKYPKDYSRYISECCWQKVYFWVLNTGIRTDANKARYVTQAPIASQGSTSSWFFYFCWNTISYIKTYF